MLRPSSPPSTRPRSPPTRTRLQASSSRPTVRRPFKPRRCRLSTPRKRCITETISSTTALSSNSIRASTRGQFRALSLLVPLRWPPPKRPKRSRPGSPRAAKRSSLRTARTCKVQPRAGSWASSRAWARGRRSRAFSRRGRAAQGGRPRAVGQPWPKISLAQIELTTED